MMLAFPDLPVTILNLATVNHLEFVLLLLLKA